MGDVMDLDVDIIEFRVPVENSKCLFVWDIQPCHTEAHIYEHMWSVFSSFGPLYLLKVCPNAPLSRPGFYCLVKFYSASHASKAQHAIDGHMLFQTTPLKVRLSSKPLTSHMLDSYKNKPLSRVRCHELANHCLGCNGWSTQIITLKELPSRTPEEEEEERDNSTGRKKTLRYGCVMKLSFPQHGGETRGAAVVEETFTETGPEVCGQKRSKLQRWVIDKAVAQAFSTVLLLLLGNGKVMVEVRPDRDQLIPVDETEGVIQVNEVSWNDFNPEENVDEDWDLTLS